MAEAVAGEAVVAADEAEVDGVDAVGPVLRWPGPDGNTTATITPNATPTRRQRDRGGQAPPVGLAHGLARSPRSAASWRRSRCAPRARTRL